MTWIPTSISHAPNPRASWDELDTLHQIAFGAKELTTGGAASSIRSNMANKRILLVGELGLDIWVEGTCEKLSPEAPVPIQRPTKITSNPGMAGNVAQNLRSLSPGIQIDFFSQSKSINKIRHIDQSSGAHLLRVDDGDDSFEPDFATQVIEGMARNPDGYLAFVASDYNKGLLSETFLTTLTDIAHEIGATMWLDSKKVLGQWSKDIDFVKINDKELKVNLVAGIKPWEWCRNLIVTNGKNGATLYRPDGSIEYHTKALSQSVFSVAGCGDSVLAALIVDYLKTEDIKQSMYFAMRVAAIAISKPGVVAVSKDEVEHG